MLLAGYLALLASTLKVPVRLLNLGLSRVLLTWLTSLSQNTMARKNERWHSRVFATEGSRVS